jgi:hypothetical protein
LLFAIGHGAITSVHTDQLTAFRGSWLTTGGTDDIIVHGYASTIGQQGANWTLSCDRAEAVQAELVRLGIPAVRIQVVAHGESTDFGTGAAPNQRVVVSTRASILPLPLIGGILTPADNFAGRSRVRFGVGETIDLSFFSLPARPATDFGGLDWVVAAGGGAIAPPATAHDGTATYTAPATAGSATLELRVAGGATASRVISAHTITIVAPSALRLVAVPGSFPSFGGWGSPPIPAGTWGAGFRGDEFIEPKDVSFRGVTFGEGSVPGVVTGTFLAARSGKVHPANIHGPGLGGNATTGTPVAQDGVSSWGGVTPANIGVAQICGASDFLWAIPWRFSVAGPGGPWTPFAGSFTANHHITSTLFCHAIIEKAGAGPFCREIGGKTC